MPNKSNPTEGTKINDYLKLGSNSLFFIPEYQRAYSWTIEECDKLWQDISIITYDKYAENTYFMGTVILNISEKPHGNRTKRVYEIIDGQQRTITFLLLLKALLICINKRIPKMGNEDESKGVSKNLKDKRIALTKIIYNVVDDDLSRDPDENADRRIYSESLIIDNRSINESYKTDLENILKSVSFEDIKPIEIKYKHNDNKYTNYYKNFRFFYEKFKECGESRLSELAHIIIEQCEVIDIINNNLEQAINMFNSLNSKGMPLRDSDIISAQLIAKSGVEIRDSVIAKWKNLKDTLKDTAEIQDYISVDSLLMQYMYYLRTINGDTTRESGNADVTTPGMRKYYTEDNNKRLSDPNKICDDLNELAKIWIEVSRLPVVKTLYKFNQNSKLFFASYLFSRYKYQVIIDEKQGEEIKENKNNKDRIIRITENLLRLFAIMEIVDTGYSSKQFKSFLFNEEIVFTDLAKTEEDIISDFNTHINKYWKKEEIKNIVLDYDKNSLVFLNEYLYAKENNHDDYDLLDHDIEHIMPQSGDNILAIREDANIDTEEEFKSLVNKLGNKIVLESKINRRLGNSWFRTKVSSSINSKSGKGYKGSRL